MVGVVALRLIEGNVSYKKRRAAEKTADGEADADVCFRSILVMLDGQGVKGSMGGLNRGGGSVTQSESREEMRM